MNVRAISAAADLICRSMKRKHTAAGIAADLDAAGMLQSPETAAELEQQATTGRMAVIEDVAAWLKSVGETGAAYLVSTCDISEGQAPGADVSPWQRAVDGLNALATAGIPVHVEPDGHISNPCGTEHIEWDRAAERWVLTHDEDDADAEPHPEPCRWPASPACTCAGPVPYALTPQATSALARPAVDKLRGILAPTQTAGA
ncbi:hypothetical protein [Streptomyces sp. NRRL S-1813]|uniref:hypothetical protein n=1 Tax=Streptomyces sp. NRRL S-1813 TaxID=1463888 RepID=UPI0004CBD081|nr:hypothetical protein [Streptomyces sp. NRRL S-1813]